MKKFVCGLLTGILLMVSIPVFGAVGEQISVAVNSIKVMINGEELTADNFVYNGRTYVQLKALTDFLGGELQWDKDNNAAVATIGVVAPTEVDPLPTKDIEESKPVTDEQQPDKSTPKTQQGGESAEEPVYEPDNTAAIEALTKAYEADIEAIERERSAALNKAITDYEISVYNLIQRGVNAQVDQMRINAITSNINNQYQPRIDARRAKYEADLAKLK